MRSRTAGRLSEPDTSRFCPSCEGKRPTLLEGRVPDVKGHGLSDLYVHVEVRAPAKLTREQRKLFEQLQETLPADNQPQDRGLFDKVKDYFM